VRHLSTYERDITDTPAIHLILRPTGWLQRGVYWAWRDCIHPDALRDELESKGSADLGRSARVADQEKMKLT
jgi:hypothetical protein